MRSAIVAAILLSSAASCGGDGDARVARRHVLAKRLCEHAASCDQEDFSEDYAGHEQDCLVDAEQELEEEARAVSQACNDADLQLAECQVEDCEHEDEDCRTLEDKVRASCSE